jgi:hypothetical protein
MKQIRIAGTKYIAPVQPNGSVNIQADAVDRLVADGTFIYESTYRVGQVFDLGCGHFHVLSQVGPAKCALISLRVSGDLIDSNRMCDPVKVKGGCYNITREELERMAGSSNIKLVEVEIKQVKS